jgi:hypothetical protein
VTWIREKNTYPEILPDIHRENKTLSPTEDGRYRRVYKRGKEEKKEKVEK